jgi:hypothetical protein
MLMVFVFPGRGRDFDIHFGGKRWRLSRYLPEWSFERKYLNRHSMYADHFHVKSFVFARGLLDIKGMKGHLGPAKGDLERKNLRLRFSCDQK